MTRELVEFVMKQTSGPIDRWAVAATLESNGIRDLDARDRYGKDDVFGLADEIYALCLAEQAATPVPEPPVARRARAVLISRRYLRGGFFFVQLALQLGSLAVFGYAQWASIDFTGRQASVVGLALLASFLLTGPASQGIGYVGSFFSEPGKHLLATRAVIAVVASGLLALLAGAVGASLLDLGFGWYGHRLLGVGLAYYALVGLLSLTGALLYMLKQFLAMVVATVAGIGVVGLVLHQTSLGIYAAHWIGLGVGIAIEATWAALVLQRRRASTSTELRLAVMPPVPVLALLVVPYGLYGLAYFGLLFVDRFAAWSAGAHGLPFTFRAPYEVGLDWALIAVVPALAMLEVTIFLFAERLEVLAGRFEIARVAEHNRELLRFRRRHFGYIVLLLLGGAAVATGALRLLEHAHATKVSGLFGDRTMLRVYALGLAGYALLVFGIFNSVFLFSLGRPWAVVRSLLPGVVVAAAVAFTLSRLYAYWTAAGGLVAGSLVFALLATAATTRTLRTVDYHYFAAY